MDPPTMRPASINIPEKNHSLPTVEEMRTEAAIATGGGSSLKSKRTTSLLAVCVLAVAAIIGISVAIAGSGGGSEQRTSGIQGGSGSSSGNGSSDGPVANTKLSRHQKVQDFLSFYSEREDLETAGSPQFFASRWIADEDLRDVDIPDSTEYDVAFRFVQRYILAVLYYATGGADWKFDVGFLATRNECSWSFLLRADQAVPASGNDSWVMGVGCTDEGEVNRIFLPGNELEGVLPNELGLLIGLEHLSTFSNNLVGPLPDNMQYLTYLKFLSIESNLFTGPVPDWIKAFTSLEYMALGDNLFEGPLPSFADLQSLKEVTLDSNLLTGSVDVFNDAVAIESLFLQYNNFDSVIDSDLFFNLDNLRLLDMSSNNLGGSLPAHFYNVVILDLHNNSISGEMPDIGIDAASPMTFLSLFNNDMSGAIPESLSFLSGLTHLDLSYNAFTGDLPAALNDLDQLTYLFLGDNEFDAGPFPNIWNLVNLQELSLKNSRRVGPIPTWVGDILRELILLDLHTNGFDSALPDSLGSLTNLAFLLLNRNELTGNIPDSFVGLDNLALFFLDTNRMGGDATSVCRVDGPDVFMTADCKDPEVDCSCCDVCCRDGESNCNAAEVMANVDDGYVRDQFVFSDNLVFYKNVDPAN